MSARDLLNGRNGNHQYNIELAGPPPEPKRNKDGSLSKRQPKPPKPKFRVPGCTTISGMLEKSGLPYAAARITAETAVYEPELWRGMPDDMAVDFLRLKHRRDWDRLAETGTIVHSVALGWAQNQDMDVLELIEFDENGRERPWTLEQRDEVLRRVNGCCDALERFWEIEQPEIWQAERTVIYPGDHWAGEVPYVVDDDTAHSGAFDAEGVVGKGANRRPRGFDWKTGGRYPTETTIQQVGYKRAPLLGVYDAEGRLIGVEAHESPETWSVVYLNDDGTYELLDLPVDEAAWQEFRRRRATHSWLRDMRQWEKANPGPEPEIEASDLPEVIESTQQEKAA